jgi:hypothetical protein
VKIEILDYHKTPVFGFLGGVSGRTVLTQRRKAGMIF